eukprot:TRINITY_DN4210_c0_g1_i1.p1 TRINITY_DN4210_c0_g1~~TRINITY_DN4210_c0_g1_i1.p1  ORF type:complete len:148 (-),score=14.56 TRINITY_DN4210_c0_g1_i1:129-572(-)
MPNQFVITSVLLHPKSVGYIELASNDPFDGPVINPKYLQHEADVNTLMKGLRKVVQLNETSHMRAVSGPPTPQPKCPHTYGTDEYLEWTIRHFTTTGYHPVGTCAMGTSKDTSVVDPELRIHQVKNLRIVDGSVIPQITSGNTVAPI